MKNMRNYKNMLNNKNAEYAIICEFKPKIHIKFIVALFKWLFYFLIGSKKRLKYDKTYIKWTGGWEILGHKTLTKSLLRGFCKLGIPYSYNKITPMTKYLILLWVDKKELELVRQLKEEGKVQKILTVPTACKHDYEYMWKFSQFDCIDYNTCGGDWVKRSFTNYLTEQQMEKVVVWPSGVDYLGEIENNTPKLKCVVYYKRKELSSDISSLLNKYGIEYKNTIYGSYNYLDFIQDTKEADFVIFYQDCVETQGIALAEVWAQNKPTIVKYNINEYSGETAPYLNTKNGRYFKDFKELDLILSEYKQNPLEFLAKFSPAKYIEENMSDEASVKKLIQIFNQDK